MSNLTIDPETGKSKRNEKKEDNGSLNLEKENMEQLSRKFLKKIAKELVKFYNLNADQAEKTAKKLEERILTALKKTVGSNGSETALKSNYTVKLVELIKKIKDKEVNLASLVTKEENNE